MKQSGLAVNRRAVTCRGIGFSVAKRNTNSKRWLLARVDFILGEHALKPAARLTGRYTGSVNIDFSRSQRRDRRAERRAGVRRILVIVMTLYVALGVALGSQFVLP